MNEIGFVAKFYEKNEREIIFVRLIKKRVLNQSKENIYFEPSKRFRDTLK